MNKRHLTVSLAAFLLLIIFLTLNYSGIVDFFIKEDKLETKSSDIEELKSLPYLSWVPVKEKGELKKVGVIKHDQGLSYEGINIYSSRPRGKAYLIDMKGNTLHSWSSHIGSREGWHHIEMSDNGALFVIIKDKLLMKLDWNSNVKWTNELRFHHDVAIAEDGDIYSFTRDTIEIPYYSQKIPILNEYLTIMSPDGEIKKKISIFDLVGDKIHEVRLNNILQFVNKARNEGTNINIGYDTPFDVFHANSLEILDRDISGFGKRGDLLISIRELNLIAIVDVKKKEVVWSWGENDLDRQHNPTLLDNGNVLIFDNGASRRFSRIVELNPIAKKIKWEYRANPPNSFYSISRGGNQRLPNGNTLITESDKGHVFEITGEGKVVWEFYNPDVNKINNKRAAIYRMMRIDLSKLSRTIREGLRL